MRGRKQFIGEGAIIGARAVIKDAVYVCPGAVVAPDAVVPPLSIVAGVPGRIIGELPTSAVRLLLEGTADALRAFQPKQ